MVQWVRAFAPQADYRMFEFNVGSSGGGGGGGCGDGGGAAIHKS